MPSYSLSELAGTMAAVERTMTSMFNDPSRLQVSSVFMSATVLYFSDKQIEVYMYKDDIGDIQDQLKDFVKNAREQRSAELVCVTNFSETWALLHANITPDEAKAYVTGTSTRSISENPNREEFFTSSSFVKKPDGSGISTLSLMYKINRSPEGIPSIGELPTETFDSTKDGTTPGGRVYDIICSLFE